MNMYKASFQETQEKKWTRREKTVAVTAAFAILIMAVAMVQNQQYYLHLYEGIGVNRQADRGLIIQGHLRILVKRGGSDRFVLAWSEHNLITNEGRLYVCDQIGGTSGTAADYIAVGTGSGGGVGDSDLQTQFSTRQQGTFAEPVAYNWTITTTFAAGFFDGEVITEAGTFDAATTGNILSYQDFTGITLTAADSLQVVFEFMVTDAG